MTETSAQPDIKEENPTVTPPVDYSKPTQKENEEIEMLKGQAQLAQNIYMNRSVTAESAMNLAKEFMDLVNKRFGQTKFAKRLSAQATVKFEDVK